MRRQCSKNSFADAGIDVKLCMKIIMEHLVCSLFPFRGVLTIAHVDVWEKRCLQKIPSARWPLPWETSILLLRHSNWWTFLLLLSNPCSAFFFLTLLLSWHGNTSDFSQFVGVETSIRLIMANLSCCNVNKEICPFVWRTCHLIYSLWIAHVEDESDIWYQQKVFYFFHVENLSALAFDKRNDNNIKMNRISENTSTSTASATALFVNSVEIQRRNFVKVKCVRAAASETPDTMMLQTHLRWYGNGR